MDYNPFSPMAHGNFGPRNIPKPTAVEANRAQSKEYPVAKVVQNSLWSFSGSILVYQGVSPLSNKVYKSTHELLDGWETRFVAPNGSPFNRE